MAARPRQQILLVSFSLLLPLVYSGSARAEISRSQARKVIARTAGFNLPTSSINVTAVNSTAPDASEASADLQLVFRLVQNDEGVWRISEIRTGQDLWEDVGVLARAANFNLPTPECHSPYTAGRRDSQLNAKRTRCLVASLFGIRLPSDEVRVKEFSSLGLPVGREISAVAVVYVRADFRLHKSATGWQVTEFKSGNRQWTNVAGLSVAVDADKRKQADHELRLMAFALEEYKKVRGRYVASDKHGVLIDHLHPRFLDKAVRVDPWHHPYLYQGEGQRFTLRCSGPDGKPDTADDITVSN